MGRILGLPVGSGDSAYRKLLAAEMTKGDRIIFGMAPGKALILVSEPGLYKLILRSDKPVARPFQDWVVGTVLPAIRKDGSCCQEGRVRTGRRLTAASEPQEPCECPGRWSPCACHSPAPASFYAPNLENEVACTSLRPQPAQPKERQEQASAERGALAPFD